MKTVKKISLALLLTFLIAAPATRAQEKVEVGKSAVQSGNFLKAIDELRDYARKEKKNSQAFYWLGAAYLVIVVLSRFFEYETSQLMKSLAFLASGVLVLVAGAYFERRSKTHKEAIHAP